LREGDPRLAGARVHLGALGVVTEVTVRVEPAFRLMARCERVPIAAAARDLEDIARSAEYVKVWWMPHLAEAYIYRYTRTGEPGPAPSAEGPRPHLPRPVFPDLPGRRASVADDGARVQPPDRADAAAPPPRRPEPPGAEHAVPGAPPRDRGGCPARGCGRAR